MLYANETITLIKCDGENYTTNLLVGVSWFDKTKVAMEGPGLAFANVTTIRIPPACLPSGVSPEVGDQVVRGQLPPELTLEKPADLLPYHPRKVMSVGDNRRGGLPHWAVVCQ